MAPYCAKHSHSWLYIWPPGDYAPPGYGGEVDHFPFTGDIRPLVVERTFVEEAVEEEWGIKISSTGSAGGAY